MPNVSGAVVLKQVRKNWGNVPVIVHTGYPDSELMMHALESSPFTVLAKPCPEQQLVETVRMVKRQSDTFAWRENRAIPDNAHLKKEAA
jgi:DNA-binding NtrC family response regulator